MKELRGASGHHGLVRPGRDSRASSLQCCSGLKGKEILGMWV